LHVDFKHLYLLTFLYVKSCDIFNFKIRCYIDRALKATNPNPKEYPMRNMKTIVSVLAILAFSSAGFAKSEAEKCKPDKPAASDSGKPTKPGAEKPEKPIKK
jgi:hypothetical protein